MITAEGGSDHDSGGVMVVVVIVVVGATNDCQGDGGGGVFSGPPCGGKQPCLRYTCHRLVVATPVDGKSSTGRSSDRGRVHHVVVAVM